MRVRGGAQSAYEPRRTVGGGRTGPQNLPPAMNPPPPTVPPGFRAAGMRCGIKKRPDTFDLGLLLADAPAPATAIFTRNQLVGAHVTLGREHLSRSGGLARAILVNSGNANCATGADGVADARRVCGELAAMLRCPEEQVLFLSTGVIGARLPIERITGALPALVDAARPEGTLDFARAVMTTDKVPKVRVHYADSRDPGQGGVGPFQVTGVAKGAGMIHPDMATMLAFLTTDARSTQDLHLLLRGIAERSFHRLTIDGDTSPNDAVILWSSERVWARPAPARQEGAGSDPLEAALLDVSRDLCRRIAADGEGATRLLTVRVHGANSEAEAASIGRTIATSPLVKTAVHGRDPNWGRILSAAGRAGVAFAADAARVWIGEADLFSGGRPHPENEPAAHLHMLNEHEVVLGVDIGQGPYAAEVWTCDYSADYVRINADYRS